MSTLEVDRLCRRVMHDQAFRAAMSTDPKAAVADLPLSETERAALLSGEVGTLYAMGANAFLLGYLVRFGLLGLTLDSYRAKLIAAEQH